MSQSVQNQEPNIAKTETENEGQNTEIENLGKTDDTVKILQSDEGVNSEPSKFNIAKINIENEVQITANKNLDNTGDTVRIQPDDGERLKLEPPQADNLLLNNIIVDNKDHTDIKQQNLEGPQIDLPPYISQPTSPVLTPLQSAGTTLERYNGRTRFYDPRTRNSFIALIMSVVFVILLATAGFIGVALISPDVKVFFQETGWVTLLPAVVGLVGANYAMMCSPCARRPPLNFIILSFGTTCVSVIGAKISTHYRTEIIMYAVLATGSVVFVCLLIACSKVKEIYD